MDCRDTREVGLKGPQSALVVVRRYCDGERAVYARPVGAERLSAAFNGEVQASGAREQTENWELGGRQVTVQWMARRSFTSVLG